MRNPLIQNCKNQNKQEKYSEDTEPPDPGWTQFAYEPFSPQWEEKSPVCIRPGKNLLSFEQRAFKKRFYPNITANQWNDWVWQIKNRLTEIHQLKDIIGLTQAEEMALTSGNRGLQTAITPYYASLLRFGDKDQGFSLRKTVVPLPQESIISQVESCDPLAEDSHSPVPGLVHRYPDRVLFLATGFCSVYCRFCTRTRAVGDRGLLAPNPERWKRAIEYIRENPSIRDVLISGGDPLTLQDWMLDYLLSQLRAIEHVEIIRIGTKIPAVLPQRITPNLCKILKKYHPLWLSLHFTHPDELTKESEKACEKLADAGIPLGSQTVLLAGVNDDLETMASLFHKLLKMRVRPYYLYQCDLIPGSEHFRTPISKGIQIIQGLRGFTSGYAVPQFVIDAPLGGGKIPISPNYIVGVENDCLKMKNYAGNIHSYPLGNGDDPAFFGDLREDFQ